MSTFAILAFFPVLMAYAAFSDLFTMRIANWISMTLAVLFVALALVQGLPPSVIVLNNLSCGAVVLLLTFGLFAMGWIGGGDAKLAAATAVWLGWQHVTDFGLLASVLGGALTVGLLFVRKYPLPLWAETSWTVRLHDKAVGVPYGIALACAGLTLYPDSSIWQVAAGA